MKQACRAAEAKLAEELAETIAAVEGLQKQVEQERIGAAEGLVEMTEWRDSWRMATSRERTRAEAAEEALRAIVGPTDSGPWIEVYREAGGGYEGLQAIARGALTKSDRKKAAQ